MFPAVVAFCGCPSDGGETSFWAACPDDPVSQLPYVPQGGKLTNWY